MQVLKFLSLYYCLRMPFLDMFILQLIEMFKSPQCQQANAENQKALCAMVKLTANLGSSLNLTLKNLLYL